MEVTNLTFNIKDVITIVLGMASALGFYYALKRQVENLSNDLNHLQKKQDGEYNSVIKAMNDHKEHTDKAEGLIYKRIDEIRQEQKTAHDKIELKIDAMSTSLSAMNTSLAELTGYLKAQKDT